MDREKARQAIVEIWTGGLKRPTWGGTGVATADGVVTVAHVLVALLGDGGRLGPASLGTWAERMALDHHMVAKLRPLACPDRERRARIASARLDLDLVLLGGLDGEFLPDVLGIAPLEVRQTRLAAKTTRLASYLRRSQQWVEGEAKILDALIICPWPSKGGDSGSPLFDSKGRVVGVLSTEGSTVDASNDVKHAESWYTPLAPICCGWR